MCRKLFAYLSLILLTDFNLPPIARGEEIVILNIHVNHVDHGEFFVYLPGEEDFLIKVTDLLMMGFLDPQGETVQIEGEPYMVLSSISGINYTLDEKTLTLKLVAQPYHFELKTINLRAPLQEEVLYPKDTSSYLNYSFDFTTVESDQQFEFSTRLASRHEDFLLVNDSVYRKNEEMNRFIRLMTHISYDKREEYKRAILGDFLAPPGEKGTTMNMAGISIQKIFLMNPHFIKYPTQDYSGAVLFPSRMEVFLDGIRIRQEDLPPGEFELKNLSTRTGSGFSEIILTDPFGNQERIIQGFYLSNRLLKKGLHEYSYSMGFLREGFGEENFDYGDLALSGFHRYGLNDQNTVELRLENTEDRYLLGPSLFTIVKPGGVLIASFANSRNQMGHFGVSGTLEYQYQSRRFSGQILISGQNPDFTKNITIEPIDKKRFEAALGAGYNPRNFGSLTFNYSYTNQRDGFDRQIISVGYSKNIWKDISFLSRFRWMEEDQNRTELLFAIHYSPFRDISLSTRYQQFEDNRSESLQIQKNTPIGEGAGGRMSYEKSESDDTFETFGEVKAKYGMVAGGYRTSANQETFQGSFAGALTYIHRTLRVTRPVRDSFALVEVDRLEGVRVYQNGQEIGKTDSNGKILIPDLNSFFDNQVTINDRDIPLDYSFPKLSHYISPPLMSGSALTFKAERFQALTGRIKIKLNGEIVPVEFYEVSMTVNPQPIVFQTTQDGEFYVENLDPGSYEATFEYPDHSCAIQIIVPPSEEIIIDIGDIICEPEN